MVTVDNIKLNVGDLGVITALVRTVCSGCGQAVEIPVLVGHAIGRHVANRPVSPGEMTYGACPLCDTMQGVVASQDFHEKILPAAWKLVSPSS